MNSLMIDVRRMKDWVKLEATIGFEPGTRGFGIQQPNH